jgi:hypothetical protein
MNINDLSKSEDENSLLNDDSAFYDLSKYARNSLTLGRAQGSMMRSTFDNTHLNSKILN